MNRAKRWKFVGAEGAEEAEEFAEKVQICKIPIGNEWAKNCTKMQKTKKLQKAETPKVIAQLPQNLDTF